VLHINSRRISAPLVLHFAWPPTPEESILKTLNRKVAVGLAAVTALGLFAGPMASAQSEKTVGLLFDISGRGDKSFNDSAAAGLDKAKAEFSGLKSTESAPTGDADRPERVKALADAKTGLIICVGFLWQKDCAASAKANPTLHYAIIDDNIEEPNAAGLKFAEEQGSFLVGVAAAQASKSNKIGFVGGVRIDLIQKFEAGFVAGVKSVKKNAKVTVAYVSEPPDFSGFGDPAKGKTIAASMFKQGIDVVYAAAGSSGLGVFGAAKESGKKPGKVWVIGVDADQYQTVSVAGGRDYILTSMLKRVDVATYNAIKAYNAGTPLTGLQTFDLAKDGVGYATSNKAIKPYRAKIDAAKKAIIAGKIVVPTKP
jgi:basic membrane protein A and related proteins